MTIVDDEIRDLVQGVPPLIVNFEPRNLSNCRYNMRAGRVFKPVTGDDYILQPPATRWDIKPSETLVIMTRESVNVPANLYASYCQLNSLAQQGLMLINVSIVEPSYQGPLSCFLVNFSNRVVHLNENAPVAKICFHRLSHAPAALRPYAITEDDYRQNLSSAAERYPVSFMDIGGVEERNEKRYAELEQRVTERVTQGVTGSIRVAVVFIAVLVFWSTVEPLVSKYIWERGGLLPKSAREEIMDLRHDLETSKNELARSAADLKAQKAISDLERQIDDQARQITELKRLIKRR